MDAATGRAVDGAVVQLTNVGDWDRDLRSDATAKTKTEGDFHLGARYNFHLALYANLSWALHFPPGSYWEGELSVTREGYWPLSFHFSERWQDSNSVRVGELRLVRTERTASPPNE